VGNLAANVVLLTDGQVGNEPEVIHLAQRYRGRVRIFAFGIGRGVSEHLIRGVARATDGAAEFIFPGERIELKVMQQFHRMGVPYAEQVQVDWGGLSVEVVTPRVWPPLFHNQRWTAYARVSQLCATTVRLQAVLAGQTYTWELPLDPECVDETPVVPLLFARSAIRDWEELPSQGTGSRQRERKEASQQRQEALVNLGCRYQLMSSATSFVAIEQRPDGDKTAEIKLRRVPIALTRGWGGSQIASSMMPSGSRSTVVRRAFMAPMPPPPTSEENEENIIVDIDLCQYEVFDETDSDEERLTDEKDNFRLLYELATHQTYEGCWALESQVVNTVNGGCQSTQANGYPVKYDP
jgi:Ca-activated chloride channel family protein